MCGRSFGWPQHRRRHEVEVHRLVVVNGEFYSRTPYVMIPLPAAPSQSSSPAQPVTPAQTLPVTTPLPPPVTPAQPPVTPTRAISVSPIGTLQVTPAMPTIGIQTPSFPVQSQSVSPAQMSVGSQGSNPPPALFLTPTPPVAVVGLASSSSMPRLRAASSSPLARPQRTRLPTMATLQQQSSSPVSSSPSPMALGSASTTGSTGSASGPPLPGQRRSSTRAASSSPVSSGRTGPQAASVSPLVRNIQLGSPSPQSPANRTCRYCLHDFSANRELNRHIQHGRCRFLYDPSTHNLNDYCVLRRPPNYNRVLAILSKLTLPDQIEMCQLNNWSIPKLWPLVFPGQLRQSGRAGESRIPPILREMTAGNKSTDILRQLLRCSPQVSLPRQIILIDESANIQSVLPTGVLTPNNSFITRISGDHIMVSSGTY